MVQRIHRNADLRNKVRKWVDVFEMAAVCDYGCFHVVFVCRFYDIPQTLGTHNWLAANNVQTYGKVALTAKVLADIGYNFFHVFRITPKFSGFVPFCKAEFAVVIACFGDMPVDDDALV